MKYLIIGGVAGGATAAARIRREDEQVEIILFEKGEYISYANCGLPYYIGDVITERGKLFLQTPASFGQRFNVDVRINSEVMEIHPQKKEVQVRRKDGSMYIETYDKLLLSPGAIAVRPDLEGMENEGIFTLRNVQDTDKIKQYISTYSIKKAVVIGAGFIGLEMAENLHAIGAQVSVVEMANQAMAPLDYSMAALVQQHLEQKGVSVYLEESVSSFAKKGEGLEVGCKSGKRLEADIVILSIGVRPETALAKQAGLKIGEKGGIAVNEYLQTSDENIYAVGDAIEFPHPLTGKTWLNYLAVPANRQGRIVADNMVFGNTIKYEGAIGTSIAKVFDMTVATTGLPAKRLRAEKIAYISSTTHSASHAGYYPGASQMSIKITFDPKTGKLYGGQIVGYAGVDKRMDQIALVIKKGGTIYDLTLLEHAYAPPYSSAKDPVAIAGYVAENILKNRMGLAYWRDVKEMDHTKITLLDVRTKDEFAVNAIPHALNIPLDELRDSLEDLDTKKPIYVYCAVGLRGYLASRILLQNGFKDVKNLSGGFKTYLPAVEASRVKVGETQIPDNGGKDGKTTSDKSFVSFQKLDSDKNTSQKRVSDSTKNVIKADACGLQCPGPIIRLKKEMEVLQQGQRLEMTSTDAGFARDAQAWCNMTGNNLLSNTSENGIFKVLIEKGGAKVCETATTCDAKGKTLIVFSDDLDKALAAFVLANGAAATGEKVSIFFTFWGLNVIKKIEKPGVKKDIWGRMFGMMLPSSSKKLKLSKMSMCGIGGKMMRHIMKIRGIESLETLRQHALDAGVEFIACQMSMDVMGVKREELLDEVTVGGVATYMERAEKANVNLFI